MSTPIDDGGPAFPNTEPNGDVTHPGMSLRDWFAGQAITYGFTTTAAHQATVATAKQCNERVALCCAKMAYEIADAMLAARKAPTHV